MQKVGAVEFCIKYGFKATATTKGLGYPDRAQPGHGTGGISARATRSPRGRWGAAPRSRSARPPGITPGVVAATPTLAESIEDVSPSGFFCSYRSPIALIYVGILQICN